MFFKQAIILLNTNIIERRKLSKSNVIGMEAVAVHITDKILTIFFYCYYLTSVEYSNDILTL